LSNFNFCPLAWHFCNKSNTSKLEKNPGEGFTIYIRGRKQDGESLFKILKHSIAMVRILLTFRDGTLAFSNNSPYVLS
jgi:hypothetical protein